MIYFNPLIATKVVFNPLFSLLNHSLMGKKCVFKHQDLQMFGSKIKQIQSNFHSLEVVGRGHETQLQVGGNFFFFM